MRSLCDSIGLCLHLTMEQYRQRLPYLGYTAHFFAPFSRGRFSSVKGLKCVGMLLALNTFNRKSPSLYHK